MAPKVQTRTFNVVNILTAHGNINFKVINAKISEEIGGLLRISGEQYSLKKFHKKYLRTIKGIFYWRVIFNETVQKQVKDTSDLDFFWVPVGRMIDIIAAPGKVFIDENETIESLQVPEEYI